MVQSGMIETGLSKSYAMFFIMRPMSTDGRLTAFLPVLYSFRHNVTS